MVHNARPTCVSNRLSGLFHKKIQSLWNKPESLFIKSAQCVSKISAALSRRNLVLLTDVGSDE